MEALKEMMNLMAAGLLLLSLLPASRIVYRLPRGSTRRAWSMLAIMMVGIILCLVAYSAGQATSLLTSSALYDLSMPGALLLGAWFIVIVSFLSARTAEDMRRLTQLERESRTDALTGVWNRRQFDETLSQEIQRARRYGTPLSLMLIDLDLFKRINDEHGHLVGDQVLSRAAQVLVNQARGSDVVARYGGEEFVLIAPETELLQARQQADRLRRAIADAIFEAAGVRLPVSASIGVATLTDTDAGPRSLVDAADAALYAAKAGGRNQVAVEARAGQRAGLVLRPIDTRLPRAA